MEGVFVKKIAVLLVALGLSAALLSGCSGGGESSDTVDPAIQEANALFDQGDYEGALEQYFSVDPESPVFEQSVQVAFEHAITLYEIDNYSECSTYLLKVSHADAESVDEKECANYLQLCYAMQSAQSGLDMLYRTKSVIRMSEEGFAPATEALQEVGAFSEYYDLAQASGLYKSDASIEHYDLVPGTNMTFGDSYAVNSYISLGDHLYATVLASEDAAVTMTADKARERAQDNAFDCEVYCVGENVFNCKAEYTDSVTEESFEMEFELSLQDGALVVSGLKTTEEPGSEVFCEGKYSKVE